jgi:DNA-binding NarL/FixJ family response regulator
MTMYLQNQPPVEVFVMHEEPLLSLGICAALREEPGIVVRCNSDRDDQSATPSEADVIVADYEAGMNLVGPGSVGSDMQFGEAPRKRVVVLSAKNSQREIRLALERGVLGYLTPDCSPKELADGVRAVKRGSRCIGLPVAERIADCLSQEPLTLREQDVLSLMAGGLSNKAIANKLGLHVGTVKCHVQSVLSKLNAASRTEAVSTAMHRGMA